MTTDTTTIDATTDTTTTAIEAVYEPEAAATITTEAIPEPDTTTTAAETIPEPEAATTAEPAALADADAVVEQIATVDPTAAIFEKIKAKQQKAAIAITARWRKLVIDIVAGKAPSVETIARLLADAGKSATDLKGDVAVRIERNQLRAKVAAAPALAAERVLLEKNALAANQKMQDAEKAYLAEINPIRWRANEIASAEAAAEDARNILTDPSKCPFLELAEELREAENELRAAANQAGHSRKMLVDANYSIAAYEGREYPEMRKHANLHPSYDWIFKQYDKNLQIREVMTRDIAELDIAAAGWLAKVEEIKQRCIEA